MLRTPFGVTILAAGVAGIVAFAAAFLTWLTTPGTSSLAALISLAWSSTFVVTAVLTWRRSRRAPPAFLATGGFLLFLVFMIFPGFYVLILPLFVVISLFAFLGYGYLRRAEPAA